MNKKMKTLKSKNVLMSLCVLFALLMCNMMTGSYAVNAATRGFSIEDGRLIDANGREFIMKGMNVAHAWYKGDTEASIKAVAETGANTVRVVLTDGDEWSKTSREEVENIINMCEEYKLVCILEVHDTTGRNDERYLLNAANYFVEIKDLIIGKEDTILINIGNEWYGDWNSYQWAQGYKKAVPVLRNAGIKNTIMIDAAGYGQFPASIHEYGKEVFAADYLKNTIFSIHMYEYAGSDAATIKNNIDKVVDQGLALCIGEFGYKHTNGDVDEDYLLNYCEEKGIGWAVWSWYGNSNELKYLDFVTNPSTNNYTEFGQIVMNHKYGMPTAKTCSVYLDSNDNNTEEQPPVSDEIKGKDLILEAENGTMRGNITTAANRAGYSGNGYVTGFNQKSDNSWSINADISAAGYYDIEVTATSDSYKENGLLINGKKAGTITTKGTGQFETIKLNSIYLEAGNNTLSIGEEWGWFDLDKITIKGADFSVDDEDKNDSDDLENSKDDNDKIEDTEDNNDEQDDVIGDTENKNEPENDSKEDTEDKNDHQDDVIGDTEDKDNSIEDTENKSEDSAENKNIIVSEQVENWNGGYTANMKLTNAAEETIKGWTLILKKDDFEITNMWGAKYSVSGDNIIVTPESWNKNIGKGSDVTFGFTGTGAFTDNFYYEVETN